MADLLGSPVLAVLVLLLLAAAATVAVLRPRFLLAGYAVAVVTNASTVVGPLGPLSIQVGLIGLLLLAVVVGWLRGRLRARWSVVYLLLVVYVAVRLLSLVSALDTGVSTTALVEEIKNVVPFLAAAVLMSSTGRTSAAIRTTAMAAVGAAALLAGLSLLRETLLPGVDFGGFVNVPVGADVGSATERHSGPESDPNFWSRHLVLLLPVALALATDRHLGRWRHTWWVAALLMAGGQYLTQSRGGLLATMLAAAVWLVLSGSSSRRLMVGALTAVVLVVAFPGTSTRLATLTMVEPGTPSRTDQSLVDRATVQQIALRMAADHPVTGVGVGGFVEAQPEYRRLTETPLSQALAPHNIYLEMLAESGVAGLAGWLVLIGGTLVVSADTARRRRRLGLPAPRAPDHLARGVTAGLFGWAVSSLFLHLAGFSVLLLVVAMVVAADVRTRELDASGFRVVRGPGLAVLTRRVARASGVGVLAAAVAATVLVVASGERWAATTTGVIVGGPAGETAYTRDVLSRPQVIATFNALASRPGLLHQAAERTGMDPALAAQATVSARHRFGSDVIELTTTHPDPVTASRLASAAGRQLLQDVAFSQDLYRYALRTNEPELQRTTTRPVGLAAACAASVLAGGLGGRRLLTLMRLPARRSPRRTCASPPASPVPGRT